MWNKDNSWNGLIRQMSLEINQSCLISIHVPKGMSKNSVAFPKGKILTDGVKKKELRHIGPKPNDKPDQTKVRPGKSFGINCVIPIFSKGLILVSLFFRVTAVQTFKWWWQLVTFSSGPTPNKLGLQSYHRMCVDFTPTCTVKSCILRRGQHTVEINSWVRHCYSTKQKLKPYSSQIRTIAHKVCES